MTGRLSPSETIPLVLLHAEPRPRPQYGTVSVGSESAVSYKGQPSPSPAHQDETVFTVLGERESVGVQMGLEQERPDRELENGENMRCSRCCNSWNDCCVVFGCRVNICSKKLELRHRSSTRKARTIGWMLLWIAVIPMAGLKPLWQLLWLFLQLILVAVLLITSLVQIVAGTGTLLWDSVYFALAIVLGLLMSVDIALVQHRRRRQSGNGETTEEGESGQSYCMMCASNLKSILQRHLDVIRLLYTEIFAFVFVYGDGATYQTFSFSTNLDRVRFVRFVLAFGLLAICYLAQLNLVIRVIVYLQRLHRLALEVHPTLNFRASNRSFLCFQVWFLVFHIAGPAVWQVAMIISSLHLSAASWSLWTITLLPFVVILPFTSTMMFFLMNYFWFQEYLIGIFIDFVTVVRNNRAQRATIPNDLCRRIITDVQDISLEDVKFDFDQLYKTNFCSKFSYAFEAPFIFILHLLYILVWTLYMVVLPLILVTLELLDCLFDDTCMGDLNFTAYFISIGIGSLSNLQFVLLFWESLGLFLTIAFSILVLGAVFPVTIVLILWCGRRRNFPAESIP